MCIICSTFALPQLSMRSLQHVYQSRLGRFFKHSGEFSSDVRECCASLVTTSITLYRRLLSSLRPTPSKIHYTFNLRDLSRVCLHQQMIVTVLDAVKFMKMYFIFIIHTNRRCTVGASGSCLSSPSQLVPGSMTIRKIPGAVKCHI